MKEYKYNVKIKKVYDGDTVYADIDLGFGIWLHDKSIRLLGIDTPEIKTKNKLEKEAGLHVTDFAKTLLKEGSDAILLSYGEDGKFGRILGDFQIGDTTYSKILLEKKFAVEYFGGTKQKPSEVYLENILKKLFH